MKKLLDWLTKIENLIMVVTFSIMVLSSFAQVLNRNFFKLPISWFDEASIYCMIYMVLIGTEVGLRDGTQIAITSIVDSLSKPLKIIVQIIAKLIVVIFSTLVFIGSLLLIDIQLRTGQISAALNLPMSIPYAAMVISFGMITLVQSLTVISIIIKVIKGEEATV